MEFKDYYKILGVDEDASKNRKSSPPTESSPASITRT